MRRQLSTLCRAFFVAMAVLWGSQAHATLIGDHIVVKSFNRGNFLGIDTVLVTDPGVELSCPGPSNQCSTGGLFSGDSIDIDGGTITVTLATVGFDPGGFGGFQFLDLQWRDASGGIVPGRITGASITSNHFSSSFDASDLTFGDDFLYVDLQDTLAGHGSFTVSLEVEHDLGPAPVPEPGTLALLSTGLASVLGCGWLRRKQTAKP